MVQEHSAVEARRVRRSPYGSRHRVAPALVVALSLLAAACTHHAPQVTLADQPLTPEAEAPTPPAPSPAGAKVSILTSHTPSPSSIGSATTASPTPTATVEDSPFPSETSESGGGEPPGADGGSIPPPAPPEVTGSETPPCSDPHPIYYTAWSAGEQQSHLWVVNPDGSGKHPVLEHPATYAAPSPSGDRIAFSSVSANGNDYDLFVVDADGTHLRQIASGLETQSQPQWSPDGQQILMDPWVPSENDPGQVMTLITVTTGEVRHLGHGREPSWAPTGDAIAFLGPGGLSLINPDGSGLRVLADHAQRGPVWSPTGDQLAFGSSVTEASGFESYKRGFGMGGVYVVNRDGSGLHRLGDGRVSDPSRIAFSSDGSQVLVSPNDNEGFPIVWVINTDGSGQRKLTVTDYEYKAAWSPNGACIILVGRPANGPLYSSGYDMQSPGNADLWIVDVDGGNPRNITQDDVQESVPLWQERFSISYGYSL